jgi:hypothetical protein
MIDGGIRLRDCVPIWTICLDCLTMPRVSMASESTFVDGF